MPTPEDKAREKIDKSLEEAGWKIQDYKSANLQASRGVVLRNFPLASGHGFADYLLYLDGKAAGVVEAKREGFPLVGVEVQAAKYSQGLHVSYRRTRAHFHFFIRVRVSKLDSQMASIPARATVRG